MRTLHVLLLAATSFVLVACGDGADDATPPGSGGAGSVADGYAGENFNQCGVAAPLPADTGQCTAVDSATIATFDDYGGTNPGGYTFYVNGDPPAENALLGGIQHVGDGSDMSGGTGVIATEMVTGVGETGFALQISNTNATNWGGLLMFYFPYQGTTAACLDGRGYAGLEFSIKGSSPSGRFGVSVGMLDTIAVSSHGLCDNASSSDCKDATLESLLPADASTWQTVKVPWSAFTPGIGSATSCVPLTGRNIVRLVIQPFMNYPPPDYVMEPGPYAVAVDNVQFYR